MRAFRARLLGSLGEGMIEGENEILGVKEVGVELQSRWLPFLIDPPLMTID